MGSGGSAVAGTSSQRQVATRTRRRRLLSLFRRDGAACVWCGTELTAQDSAAICSRLVRAVDGGPGTLGNAVASCASCHALRGRRTAAHWLLISLDRDVLPNFEAVERALRDLRDAFKPIRAHTNAQLQLLAHGRLPGEVGGEGRRRRIVARDGPGCVWCSKHLPATAADSTVEHVVPRAMRGPETLANSMCACRDCNSRRGPTAVAAWVADCEARGRIVRRAALERVLSELASAGGRGSRLARVELRALMKHHGCRADTPARNAETGHCLAKPTGVSVGPVEWTG
jgi:hypothetical protein